MITEPRLTGWDSKVRARVTREYGSISRLATEVGIEVAALPMHTWSRLVTHFDGTGNLEDYLNRSHA
ncbi:MAG: hypothetical protein ABR616_18080 [Dermatophilaceae bacterium]